VKPSEYPCETIRITIKITIKICETISKSPPYPCAIVAQQLSSIAAQHGFLRRQLSRREGFKSGATW